MEPMSVADNMIPGTPSPTYESTSACFPLPLQLFQAVPRFFPFAMEAQGPAEADEEERGLLEELRVSPSDFLASRTLVEVFPEASAFASDQHGSRFLQTSMEKASGAEIHGLFLALLPALARLTVDPFGNYVVQKLLEILSHEHRLLVGEQLLGQVLALSTNTYGCRVIQKLLDLSEGGAGSSLGQAMGRELETQVLTLVEDQNGNHVIQKAIERLPDIAFILSEVRGHIPRLALHCYGCRVVQRLLERANVPDEGGVERAWREEVVEEVMTKIWRLSTDQFGNYVVQHVLVYGSNLQRDAVVRAVAERVVDFSCHKYASNVAERALVVASECGRALIIAALLKPGRGSAEPAILALTRDRYANYVVQRCVQVSTGSQKAEIVRILRSQLSNLKKVVYGKHILAAIDKQLVHTRPPPSC